MNQEKPKISVEREQRLIEVALQRQLDMTVVLENVHDPHNISAVLRSCDAVGIREIFVLYTEPQLTQERLKIGRKTSGGSRKWVEIHYYRDTEACFQAIRDRYRRIYCAMPTDHAEGLWAMDLTSPLAMVFGNERDGISPFSRSFCDGDFSIPMAGMAKSLNISVACAVSLYEVYRQRFQAGMYNNRVLENASDAHQLLAQEYLERATETYYGQINSPKGE